MSNLQQIIETMERLHRRNDGFSFGDIRNQKDVNIAMVVKILINDSFRILESKRFDTKNIPSYIKYIETHRYYEGGTTSFGSKRKMQKYLANLQLENLYHQHLKHV